MQESDLVLNGRFLAATPVGVHRVAEELVRALDRIRALHHERSNLPCRLLCPPNIRRVPSLSTIPCRVAGRLTSHAWEQIELPRLAKGAFLVNLCNVGPIAKRDAITLIHDAQVFTSPQSYSRAFRAWYRFVLPRIGRAHSQIATVSEFSRRELARHGVAPYERIAVIYNGADHMLGTPSNPAAIRCLGLEPRSYAVGLASTQAHKNIPMLMKAFSGPELSDLKLVLFGGASKSSFEGIGVQVPPNVVFAGRIDDGELRALFEGALCTLFPSTTEGFGLPPLEAMAVGCPAIVAPCGALPEICGSAAKYADPNAPLDWVAAIEELRAESVWQARSRICERHAARFTWEKAAGQLLGLIEAAIGARRATSEFDAASVARGGESGETILRPVTRQKSER